MDRWMSERLVPGEPHETQVGLNLDVDGRLDPRLTSGQLNEDLNPAVIIFHRISSIHSSVHHSFIHPSIHPFSTHPSIHPFIHSFICPMAPIHPSRSLIRNVISFHAPWGGVLRMFILEPRIVRGSLILHYELTYSVKSIRRLFQLPELASYFLIDLEKNPLF